MAGFLSVKMKRKDLEDVSDDFSDFSLSSPARKIRRLDAELPPIMEEEEPMIPPVLVQPLPDKHLKGNTQQLGSVVIEEVPSIPLNQERALVLYKPVNAQLQQLPSLSNHSFKVNMNLIPGFKNQVFRYGYRNLAEEVVEDKKAETNRCLDVVPWVPSHLHIGQQGMEETVVVNGLPEAMESEELEPAPMDVEEGNSCSDVEGQMMGFPTNKYTGDVKGMEGSEGLQQQQWQQQHQQHFMNPHLPQTTSTPIMWSL